MKKRLIYFLLFFIFLFSIQTYSYIEINSFGSKISDSVKVKLNVFIDKVEAKEDKISQKEYEIYIT
jgi:hypothetical protein